jgi:hypothetical protein
MSRLQGKTVAIVGDSLQVGPFGRSLVKLLEGAGARVAEDARTGRSIPHLYADSYREMAECAGLCLKGTSVLPALAATSPDIFIIRLGGNDAALWGTRTSKYTDTFGKLRQSALDMGAKEVWLVSGFGSLDSNGRETPTRQAFLNAVRPIFGDYFVDVFEYTKDVDTVAEGRTPDMMHYQKWFTDTFVAQVANRIIAGVEQESALAPLTKPSTILPILAATAIAGIIIGVALRRRRG